MKIDGDGKVRQAGDREKEDKVRLQPEMGWDYIYLKEVSKTSA